MPRAEIIAGKLEGVRLFCQPKDVPLTWDEFVRRCPPFSIALDGYVNSKPLFDPKGPHLNLDHHTGVDRLTTRATCGQTLVVIRQGLFNAFKDNKGAKANVFVNDCDQDVALSFFLLKYGKFAAETR